VPRVVLFDLGPGVINAVRASPFGELFRPGNLVNENAGAGSNWAKAHNAHNKKDWVRILMNPPVL
jgi:tubulin beta